MDASSNDGQRVRQQYSSIDHTNSSASTTYLDKGFGAGSVELVLQCSQTEQRVDVAGVQDIVILAQLDGGLHGGIQVPCSTVAQTYSV